MTFPGHPDAIDPADLPVRFSALKLMSTSPRHYWDACQPREPYESSAMRLGSGVHALLLGQPCAVWQGKVRNGREWETFRDQHRDMPILNVRENAVARAMCEAVLQHEHAPRVLFGAGTQREQRVEVERDGMVVQGRPDVFSPTTIVELKTCRTAEPYRLMRDASQRHYHAQLAWYADLLAEAGRATISEAYIVAVESQRPHPVTVLRLTSGALELGRATWRHWWGTMLACCREGQWPGYSAGVLDWSADEAGGAAWGAADDDEGGDE
jgi:hypothetical protein